MIHLRNIVSFFSVKEQKIKVSKLSRSLTTEACSYPFSDPDWLDTVTSKTVCQKTNNEAHPQKAGRLLRILWLGFPNQARVVSSAGVG
jgi:hypothetical protein